MSDDNRYTILAVRAEVLRCSSVVLAILAMAIIVLGETKLSAITALVPLLIAIGFLAQSKAMIYDGFWRRIGATPHPPLADRDQWELESYGDSE